MKDKRIFVCFVTLPQLLMSAVIAAFSKNAEAFWLLAASCVANLMLTVSFFVLAKNERHANRLHLVSAAVFSVILVLPVFWLNDSAIIHGFISVRLAAMLLSGVSVLYALIKTAQASSKDIAKNVIAVAAVPLICLLAFNLISGAGLDTAAIILLVAGGIVMIYLVFNIVFARAKEKIALEKTSKKFVLYLIFSLLLPLVGLLVSWRTDNMLGDFSDPFFFIVAAANGLLLVLPPPAEKRLKLLRFFMIAAGTTYLVYFFIVFLPLIPAGFVGLIILLGALVFAPAAALVMQIIHFIEEWPRVCALWGAKRVLAVFIAGLLLLPALVLSSFIGDRQNLKTAISYMQQDIGANGADVDMRRLERALCHADGDVDETWLVSTRVRRNTPLISSVYTDMVFDGQFMSPDALARLRQIFLGEAQRDLLDRLTAGAFDSEVELKSSSWETEYDPEIKAYRMRINLILVPPPDAQNAEYVTEFVLPEGVYITDYYLDVGDERKPGILADRRAALWMYESLVAPRQSKDPGLLHYTGNRTVELRVYPFNGKPRYTGFEIIYREKTRLYIDGQDIYLPAYSPYEVTDAGSAVFIPAQVKLKLLETPARPPSYYFVIDSSQDSDVQEQLERVRDYAAVRGIGDAKVVFTSYKLDIDDLAQAGQANPAQQGGFNLGYAIRYILTENGSDTYPVILFTSDNPKLAIMPSNVSFLAANYPETLYFYRLNEDETLTAYDYVTVKSAGKTDAPVVSRVLGHHGLLVKDDECSQLVPKRTGRQEITGNQYEQAVALDIASRSSAWLNAEEAYKLVRASFKAGVLTPQTAFIVVETDAQEAQLYERQKQLLKEDKQLIEEKQRLDEPSAIVCVIVALLGAGMLALKKVKKRRAS